LSIPQKVRTGNVVMDANLRAALTQENLLCPIGASVVHRMGLDSAGVVRLSPLSTKKIKGLHENDFIMASKIDRLLDRPDGFLDHKQ
jgi:4a-hydroxytetrahydrobiopterin dehydratase